MATEIKLDHTGNENKVAIIWQIRIRQKMNLIMSLPVEMNNLYVD